MAQGVQCLLRKFEDLSPDPRNLSKAGYGSMQFKPECSHVEKDGEGRAIPGRSQPARLEDILANSRRRACLQQDGRLGVTPEVVL